MSDNAVAVGDPPRCETAARIAFAAASVLFLLVAAFDLVTGQWVYAFNSVCLAFAWAMFAPLRRAWYRMGYRAGGGAALESAHNAARAGVEIEEWIWVELTAQSVNAVRNLGKRWPF